MTHIDNISPGDVVTLDRKGASVPFVVLKTGKAKEFDESIKQQSGLKSISECPSDQAQVTLVGQVESVTAEDLLVRLVPVPEFSKRVPVWWQIDSRFYRLLASQLQLPSRFVPVMEVQPLGRDGVFCYNCGNSESSDRTVAKISLIQQSQCNRCQTLQEESVLTEDLLHLCDGDAEKRLEDIENSDYHV